MVSPLTHGRGGFTGFTAGTAGTVFAHGGALANGGLGDPAVYAYTDPAHAHAVTAVSGLGTFAYDANGNMTQRVENGTVYTQTFDVENRLVSVAVGSTGTTTYHYDAGGQLVKKTAPDGTVTVYLGLVEYEISGGVTQTTSYYALPGARVVRLDTTLAYVLTDHLGSATVTVDDQGATVTAELRYFAYGATRLSTGATPTERRYTGQLQQADVGLYYYNARWYSPGLSRWVQPDTIVPNAAYSQSLNRYAFVRSNPIRYSDPSGHRECDDQDHCGAVHYRREAPNWLLVAKMYGVTFKNWDTNMLEKVLPSFVMAIHNVGAKFSEAIGGTATSAFRAVYGNISMEFCDNCVDGMGWAKGDHTIAFDSTYGNAARQMRVVTHELGHIFDRMVCASNTAGGSCENIWANSGTARSELAGHLSTCRNSPIGPTCMGRATHDGPEPGEHWGFAGGWEDWQFGANDTSGEIWADMFLGWTYDSWEDSDRGNIRREYMNAAMSSFLTTNFAAP